MAVHRPLSHWLAPAVPPRVHVTDAAVHVLVRCKTENVHALAHALGCGVTGFQIATPAPVQAAGEVAATPDAFVKSVTSAPGIGVTPSDW